MRPPSSFGITVGWPPSMIATAEFVVPRSIPITLPESAICVAPSAARAAAVGGTRKQAAKDGPDPAPVNARAPGFERRFRERCHKLADRSADRRGSCPPNSLESRWIPLSGAAGGLYWSACSRARRFACSSRLAWPAGRGSGAKQRGDPTTHGAIPGLARQHRSIRAVLPLHRQDGERGDRVVAGRRAGAGRLTGGDAGRGRSQLGRSAGDPDAQSLQRLAARAGRTRPRSRRISRRPSFR